MYFSVHGLNSVFPCSCHIHLKFICLFSISYGDGVPLTFRLLTFKKRMTFLLYISLHTTFLFAKDKPIYLLEIVTLSTMCICHKHARYLCDFFLLAFLPAEIPDTSFTPITSCVRITMKIFH